MLCVVRLSTTESVTVRTIKIVLQQRYVKTTRINLFWNKMESNFNLSQYLSSQSTDRDVKKSLRRVVSWQKKCTKQSLLRQKSKSMVMY